MIQEVSPSEPESPSESESPSEPESPAESQAPSTPAPDNNNNGGNPPAPGTTAPTVQLPVAVNADPVQGALGARIEMPAEEESGESSEAERGVLGERRGAQTGDTTPVLGWAALFGAAALVIEEVFRKKRSKK